MERAVALPDRIDLEMRCLVVADLHYSLPQFDWLLSAASQFDLVIFAGDALDVGSSVDERPGSKSPKKIAALFDALRSPSRQRLRACA